LKHFDILKENKWIYDWVEYLRATTAFLRKLQKKGIPVLQKNVEVLKALGD
tara:strand:- start:3745 stop:3897 length:153 start_codon:yes stop_codon:yes gene_type:complete